MLTYHQQNLLAFILGECLIKYSRYQSPCSVWNYHLWNTPHLPGDSELMDSSWVSMIWSNMTDTILHIGQCTARKMKHRMILDLELTKMHFIMPTPFMGKSLGGRFKYKNAILWVLEIPLWRWFYDRHIFTMGFPILVYWIRAWMPIVSITWRVDMLLQDCTAVHFHP